MLTKQPEVGDHVWTWSLTVWGTYIPHFSSYLVSKVVEEFVCLEHSNQPSMAMPSMFVYETRIDAINGFIKLIETLKDE